MLYQLFIDENNLKIENYTPNFNTAFSLLKEYFIRLIFYKYRKKNKKYY
jgi:hypothetical protein